MNSRISLEGSILEDRLYQDALGVESISTAKLFGLANTSGISIHEIDASNIDAALQALPFSENILEAIEIAVHQGLSVRIPAQKIAYEAWTGCGYILQDAETGESGWMLSGRIGGGMTVIDPDHWPAISYADLFKHPNTPKPNTNPEAARYIQRLALSSNNAVVGTEFGEPLRVLVQDANYRPVSGVKVEFITRDGGGTIIGENPAITDSRGIAEINFRLGEKTDANPAMIWEPENRIKRTC